MNTIWGDVLVKSLSSRDKKSWMTHQNAEQRSNLGNAESEHDATDLARGSVVAVVLGALVSRDCTCNDSRAENIQLTPTFNARKLEIANRQLTFLQRWVTVKVITSPAVGSEMRVEPPKIENLFLMQTNDNIHQRLQLSQKLPSLTEKPLIDRPHSKIIWIAVNVDPDIHMWYQKLVSELAHLEKHIHRN